MHRVSKSVTAPNTGKTYAIKGHNTCETKKLLYLLQCKILPSLYIGKTINTLRSRVNGHRQSVKEAKPLPVAQNAINEHNLHKLEDCFEIKVIRSFPEKATNSDIKRFKNEHTFEIKSNFQSS